MPADCLRDRIGNDSLSASFRALLHSASTFPWLLPETHAVSFPSTARDEQKMSKMAAKMVRLPHRIATGHHSLVAHISRLCSQRTPFPPCRLSRQHPAWLGSLPETQTARRLSCLREPPVLQRLLLRLLPAVQQRPATRLCDPCLTPSWTRSWTQRTTRHRCRLDRNRFRRGMS